MFLQTLNEEDLLSQFSLEEIDALFTSAIQLNPDDIALKMEYVCFLYNVLDKEQEALSYYEKLKDSVLLMFDKFEKKGGR